MSRPPWKPSESGWATVDVPSYGDSYPENNGAIFNPAQTLHVRTNSSHSDSTTFGSYEEIMYPLRSPDSESHLEFGQDYYHHAQHHHCPSISPIISPSAVVEPVPIKPMSPLIRPSPIRTSPMSQGMRSPPARRQSRKSPTDKATKPLIRRPSAGGKKDTEKRVGRRRGPLLPEQRKQASEIRKLRACLRCKFLKKTVRYPKDSETSPLPRADPQTSVTKENPVVGVSPRMRDSGRSRVHESTLKTSPTS